MKIKKLIHLLAYDKMSMLDFSGPLDVFLTANNLSGKEAEPYDVEVLSVSGKVNVTPGFMLETRLLGRTTTGPHTIIIPGGPDTNILTSQPELIELIKLQGNKACRMAAICSGAFALAAAGFLEGRRATTHWSFLDEMQVRFPNVKLQRGPIFVRDETVWTSAGLTAGIDLALALVEQDLGETVALKIARNLVLSVKRPANHYQTSEMLSLQSRSGQFSDLHAWIIENLSEDLSVNALASRMNMSTRTFIRHYAAELHLTPAKGVELLRLSSARHYLEHSSFSVSRISRICGYSSEAIFIRRFSIAFDMSPGRWRSGTKKSN